MTLEQNIISDATIVAMIEQNEPQAWGYLHNKYTAMLYGAILRIINSEVIAQEILTKLFVQLRENKMLLYSKKPLCLCLLHHAYTTATQFLETKQIATLKAEPVRNAYSILNNLVYKQNTLKDVAEQHAINENDAKLQLRAELNRFRAQNLQHVI